MTLFPVGSSFSMRNAKPFNESLVTSDHGLNNDLGYSGQACCCVKHFDSHDMIRLWKIQHFLNSR